MTFPRTQKEIRRAIKDLPQTRFALESLRQQLCYALPEDKDAITDRINQTAAYIGIMDDAIAHIPTAEQEIIRICQESDGAWQSTLANTLMISQPTACRRLHAALRSLQIALTGEATDD